MLWQEHRPNTHLDRHVLLARSSENVSWKSHSELYSLLCNSNLNDHFLNFFNVSVPAKAERIDLSLAVSICLSLGDLAGFESAYKLIYTLRSLRFDTCLFHCGRQLEALLQYMQSCSQKLNRSSYIAFFLMRSYRIITFPVGVYVTYFQWTLL